MNSTPLVSILMVARNTGPFIGDAIASARAQTCADIEIIVVDDASSDETRAVAQRHAAQDARVRVLDGPRAGLAAVRNASLAAARGQWMLILDSDDVLAPGHVAQLVAAARRSGAEMVAANMIEFRVSGGQCRARRFAAGQQWEVEREIGLAEFLRANCIYADGVPLGYLKPMFRKDFFDENGLLYDLTLRVGEDLDLVVRAMLAKGRYQYVPQPSYFYRRHAASTSARLPVSSVAALIRAATDYRLPDDGQVRQAEALYRRSLQLALRFGLAVEHAKARQPVAAIRTLGMSGAAWRQLGRSACEGVARRLKRPLRSQNHPASRGGEPESALIKRLQAAAGAATMAAGQEMVL